MDISLKTFNDYNDYANQLFEEYDIIQKREILSKTIKFYNEMNSFINNNIVDLDYNNIIFEAKDDSSKIGTSWLRKIWNFLLNLVDKIKKAIAGMFETQVKKQDETISLIKSLKSEIESLKQNKNNETESKPKKTNWFLNLFKGKDKNSKKISSAIALTGIAPAAAGALYKSDKDSKTLKETIELGKKIFKNKSTKEAGASINKEQFEKSSPENKKLIEEAKKEDPTSFEIFDKFIGYINKLSYLSSIEMIRGINKAAKIKQMMKSSNQNAIITEIKKLYSDKEMKLIEDFSKSFEDLGESNGPEISLINYGNTLSMIISDPSKIEKKIDEGIKKIDNLKITDLTNDEIELNNLIFNSNGFSDQKYFQISKTTGSKEEELIKTYGSSHYINYSHEINYLINNLIEYIKNNEKDQNEKDKIIKFYSELGRSLTKIHTNGSHVINSAIKFRSKLLGLK